MPVVGTAGHVDHGKSTLVQALTGRDPDRWAEEKARGLTIDLGFAWTVLDGELEASFVDVPGHERFIKNMLAGTEAIDVALMVVAADEGWMPQSEEHLAVLDLLEVRHGVVALTKIDRVDADLRELATLETSDRLAGTALADAPIIPVSAITGEGLSELRSHLAVAAASAERERGPAGDPRLWVDRSFTIRGAGTVVTGSLLDGPIEVGDEVEIWPAGTAARVRSLQSHEQVQERVEPGRRCAVNLAGIERTTVGRGSLLAKSGTVTTTTTAAVGVRIARFVDGGLDRRGAYHLHLGTGVWPIEFRPVEGDAIATRGVAIVRADQPFPASVGDRFVIRETGRQSVVAGGRILDPGADNRPARSRPHVDRLWTHATGTADEVATSLLAIRGVGSKALLARWTKGGSAAAGLEAGDVVMTEPAVAAKLKLAVRLVESFHSDHPLRPGQPKASLASRLDLDLATLDALLARTDDLRDDGATVAASHFHAGLTADQELEWARIAADLTASELSVPRLGDLAIDREMLHVLLREGRLVRVSEDLCYLPDQLADLERRLAGLPAEFTVAEFKDEFAISRKFAMPLLEWLDARGTTVRRGDTRRLKHGKGRPEGRPSPHDSTAG